MNALTGIRPKGGVKTRPHSFFPWCLRWGLSVFQWGSNPHNSPANFYPVRKIHRQSTLPAMLYRKRCVSISTSGT